MMKLFLCHIFFVFACTLYAADISVYGNIRTPDQVILRELTCPLSFEKLYHDRAWLQRLDFLKRIDFMIQRNEASAKPNLIIIVQEKPVYEILPIIDNHDVYGWLGGVQLTQRNKWGRRESISLAVETGKRKTISASYKEPWIAGKHHLMYEVLVYYRIADYLYQDYSPHFSMEQTAALAKTGKGFGRYFQAGIQMGIESMITSDKAVTLSHGHEDLLVTQGLYFKWDNRDWPVYPASGWLVDFNLFETKVRQNGFKRGSLEINHFRKVRDKQILALQLRYAGSEGTLPVYKRLHLGGVKSLRGYKAGQFGGNHMLYSSAEYRFPMFYLRHPDEGVHLGWIGFVFWDTGSAWYQMNDLEDIKWHHSAGLGIHAILDSWRLRIEYGQLFRGLGYISAGTSLKF